MKAAVAAASSSAVAAAAAAVTILPPPTNPLPTRAPQPTISVQLSNNTVSNATITTYDKCISAKVQIHYVNTAYP